MSDPTLESVRAEHKAQQALLGELRTAGKPAEAAALEKNYHGQQMASLAKDVYESARGEGKPPPGWVRASEHPEQLQAMAPSLSKKQIDDMLHPDKSGYRAEIYLPDKSVLGQDAKPVLVFKGSTGMIIDPAAPGGKRESANEDFLSNNIPQGLGLKTDYYDRAMATAVLLKDQPGFKFEIAGHSLGGGMASAAEAVTGVHTTTFNAAGLHANTAERFAKENGLTVYNTKGGVTAFQVGGEMLTNGQEGIQHMNAARRLQAGMLANDIASLMETPGAKELVQKGVRDLLPPHARQAAQDSINFLATHSGNQALRNLPTAAGDLQPLLSPKTRDDQGRLVNRPNELALSELAGYAGPLTNVLSVTAMSARAGKAVGEHVQAGGKVAEQGLHVAGKVLDNTVRLQGELNAGVTQTVGKIGSTTVNGAGEVTAQVRLQAGNAAAAIDHAEGKLQQSAASWTATAMRWGSHALPDGAEKWVGRQAQGVENYGNAAMQRNQQEALQARASAQTDATHIRQGTQAVAGKIDQAATTVANAERKFSQQTGAAIQHGTDAAGHGIRTLTDKAPVAGMAVGGTVGAVSSTIATHAPVNVQNTINLYNTVTVLQRGKEVAGEAVFRHGMAGSVIPSLDAAVEKQEQAAKRLLAPQPTPANGVHPHITHPITPQQHGAITPSMQPPAAPITTAVSLDHPSHPNNGLFVGAQKGVYALDQRFKLISDIYSDQLAGTLSVDAHAKGLAQIQRVDLSKDGSRVVAGDTADPNAAHQRLASAEVKPGREQTLVASTQQIDQMNQQLTPQLAPQTQQVTQAMPTPAAAKSM